MSKLKIKNGKLYGSNYSFALPEEFNLEVETDFLRGNKLVFVSFDEILKDELLQIEIYFEKQCNSAKDNIQEIVDDSCLIKMGDFLSVKRGEGLAVGLCYGDGFNQYYEERYDFEKNEEDETQLIIDISLLVNRKKSSLTMQEVLELPTVKAFLDGIRYYK